jgi:hypothetical protein
MARSLLLSSSFQGSRVYVYGPSGQAPRTVHHSTDHTCRASVLQLNWAGCRVGPSTLALAMTKARGDFTTHRVLYPYQQRRKRLVPNLHSTIPFSMEPPLGRSCYARRWEPCDVHIRYIKKNAFFNFCDFKIIL